MHLHGLTEDQLAHVAVVQRRNAQLNPLAVFRDPLTVADYLAAPYVVEPLRRADICMISDGGVCLIVTTPERAGDFPHRPVHLLGGAQQTGLRYLANHGPAAAQLGPSGRRSGCTNRRGLHRATSTS